MKIANEERSSQAKAQDDSSDEKEGNVEDEDDSDVSELREMDNGCAENDDYDDVSILLNGNYHKPT